MMPVFMPIGIIDESNQDGGIFTLTRPDDHQFLQAGDPVTVWNMHQQFETMARLKGEITEVSRTTASYIITERQVDPRLARLRRPLRSRQPHLPGRKGFIQSRPIPKALVPGRIPDAKGVRQAAPGIDRDRDQGRRLRLRPRTKRRLRRPVLTPRHTRRRPTSSDRTPAAPSTSSQRDQPYEDQHPHGTQANRQISFQARNGDGGPGSGTKSLLQSRRPAGPVGPHQNYDEASLDNPRGLDQPPGTTPHFPRKKIQWDPEVHRVRQRRKHPASLQPGRGNQEDQVDNPGRAVQ